MIVKKCINCRKDIICSPCHVRDNKKNFCSISCASLYRNRDKNIYERLKLSKDNIITNVEDIIKMPISSKIEIYCSYCSGKFYTNKRNLYKKTKTGKRYCSSKCFGLDTSNALLLKCDFCLKEFKRVPSDIKSELVFCSHKCCNRGLKRSSAEIFFERKIKELYFKENVIFNSRAILNNKLELDIYFPEKKFAIELNGPYHYIDFKDNNFSNIKQRDLLKVKLCTDKDIDLFTIDIRAWKKQNMESKFNDIKSIIDQKLNR